MKKTVHDFVRKDTCVSEYQYNKDMADACTMTAWECLIAKEPDLARFFSAASRGFDLRNKKES